MGSRFEDENDVALSEYLYGVNDDDELFNYILDDDDDEYLAHYGVGPDDNPPGRGSGRYPKGFGENPYQHDESLSKTVSDLKKQGLSMSDIARGLGYVSDRDPSVASTTKLRAALSIEKNERQRNLSVAVPKYKATGMSNVAIAKKLGISEGSVRDYLKADRKLQMDKTTNVANALKEELKNKRYIDVGPGVELEIANGVSRTRLNTALEMLKSEGYKVHVVKVEQMGNKGQFTSMRVLGDKDTEWKEIQNDPSLIKPFQSYVIDNGTSIRGLLPVKSIDSKRVFIRYTDENDKGGVEKDGTIELRRGVEDISLGPSMYAQVRIGVDGDKYMKGMAHYSDNIPDGYDIVYNTNKKVGTPPEEVFKPMKRKGKDGTGPIDQDNPFGASIKRYDAGGQSYCLDKDGNETGELRVINKVTDQGDWDDWSRTISPQMLAKQPLPLVRRQLDLSYKDKAAELAEIKALTNPTVKRQLLESFADDCDASAAHLKAHSFPGQASKVILPVPSLKGGTEEYRKRYGVDGEIYAPTYEHGSTVALVRFPHAGTFEIPILRVNNHNKEAKSIMGNAPDAVGINHDVADRLSGADFDGDTVVVIPTEHTNIKSTPRLKGLIGFNTKDYKFADKNAPGIKSQTKQTEMGKVTNLIQDMQIKGASEDQVVRAVKHSMVVIDSEKHHLDYKKSFADNRIEELYREYQMKPDGRAGGASTLITRAKSEYHQDKEKLVSIEDPETGKKYYGIDPVTGKKATAKSGETYKKYTPAQEGHYETRTRKNGTTYEKYVPPTDAKVETKIRQETIHKMDHVEDARDLMSSKSNPYPVELEYANYANNLKALANEARKELVGTPRLKRDPAAAKKYAPQVESLNANLRIALKNAPRERQAQAISTAEYKKLLKAHPELKEDKAQLKRLRGQLLDGARTRMGAKKTRIPISDIEWEAIQNGAISDTNLMQILRNTKSDDIRKRATPRNDTALSAVRQARIKAMSASGFTLKQIADELGVSPSTVSRILKG